MTSPIIRIATLGSRQFSRALRHSLAIVAGTVLLITYVNEAALAQSRDEVASAEEPAEHAHHAIIKTLRHATARYRDLAKALDDGFVLLHECESRGDEGPVGTVYVNLDRLQDGVIDPELPDALIYEPRRYKRPKLVGVEFAIPYTLWTEPQPPQFLGATFQREDEFGVFGLHAWVWRMNPDGLFAETNPRVSCDAR